MKRWLERNSKALQALAAVIMAFAALAALIGVKIQIDANVRQQREQSARDIYREFLNLAISKPALAEPVYCAIRREANPGAYENFVEYMLYTSDQLLSVSRDWEPTMMEHLAGHREFLCRQQDWSDDSAEIRALMARFQTGQCKDFAPAC